MTMFKHHIFNSWLKLTHGRPNARNLTIPLSLQMLLSPLSSSSCCFMRTGKSDWPDIIELCFISYEISKNKQNTRLCKLIEYLRGSIEHTLKQTICWVCWFRQFLEEWNEFIHISGSILSYNLVGRKLQIFWRL